MSYRVALVGAGLAGRSHAFDVMSYPDLELTAICAPTEARARPLADLLGVRRVFGKLEDLLRYRCFDAVVVAVPSHVALEVIRVAIRQCLPMLVEKPIAVTARQRQLLVEMSRSPSAPVVVPFNRRYRSHVRKAIGWLSGGTIGALVDVAAAWRGPYRHRYATDAPTHRARAGARQGLLVDSGSQAIDTLLWALPTLSVTSASIECNSRGADVEFDVRFRATDGVGGRLVAQSSDSEELTCLQFSGHCGTITVSDREAVLDSRSGYRRVAAGEVHRPVDDLVNILAGRPHTGATLREAVAVSDFVMSAYNHASISAGRQWHRPRAKPWGRLNGSC